MFPVFIGVIVEVKWLLYCCAVVLAVCKPNGGFRQSAICINDGYIYSLAVSEDSRILEI